MERAAPREPVHSEGKVVDPAEVNVGGDFAAFESGVELIGSGSGRHLSPHSDRLPRGEGTLRILNIIVR
jgi:hypothetical protein